MVNSIKDKILDAALEQFLIHGKAGTTTKNIAEAAGVNKALIHYYFSSKEMLFICCVKNILENMEATFHKTEVRSITEYKEYLNALITSYTTFIKQHDKHIIFLLWEYLNDKDLITEIKNIIGSSHLIDFISKTQKAITDGVIREIDPLDLYLNLISLILSTYMILPITLSFLGEDRSEMKDNLTKKREAEISRLLWEDVKKENR
ncbi:MAG: TetR/AcrR family transcriptional regulator [Spirochaetales bacterium]|nr:TetR/AcrR family transcriptional regulator [Spirochaetales bacterium]